MSFRGFVDALQAEASAGQAAEAPILEEGSDGVRLMTVHKAKGSEFPVVILADITARLTPYEAGRHIDNERPALCAAHRRVVAEGSERQPGPGARPRTSGKGSASRTWRPRGRATCSSCPAVGDGPYTEGWVSPLNRAVYPPETRAAHPGGCRTGARRSRAGTPS